MGKDAQAERRRGIIVETKLHVPEPRQGLVRRDSLVAAGDSTIVISLFLPVPFVRNAARDTGGTRASAVMSTAEKVITGASRMQRQTELDQLKAYFDRSRHPDD